MRVGSLRTVRSFVAASLVLALNAEAGLALLAFSPPSCQTCGATCCCPRRVARPQCGRAPSCGERTQPATPGPFSAVAALPPPVAVAPFLFHRAQAPAVQTDARRTGFRATPERPPRPSL